MSHSTTSIPFPKHKRFEDITGQVFNRLTVLKYLGVRKDGYRWLCSCACGGTVEVCSAKLKKGKPYSCGCWQRERASASNYKHGMCGSPTYYIWAEMVQRCTNPDNPSYRLYGERGIGVAPRWLEFSNFLADMGVKPAKRSLERRDNEKGYGLDNCYWATTAEQSRNRRVNHRITFKGKTQCLVDWARETGMHVATLADRIANGWSYERALTTPVMKRLHQAT